MKVAQAMTADLAVVGPETLFKDLVELMLDRAVSGLPVVDSDGRLVGIVTEADLLRREAHRPGRWRDRALSIVTQALAGEDPVWVRRAEGLTAGDIMSQPVVTVGPDDDVGAAARTMLRHRVKRLPVVLDTKLVGLIARPDIMRVFEHFDTEIEATPRTASQEPASPTVP